MPYLKKTKNKSKTVRVVLLIDLLKTFTKEELDHFYEFTRCTFFNGNKHLCKLLKQLRCYALNTAEFSEAIQLKIYQEVCKKAIDQTSISLSQKKELNKLMNNLLALAEDFLVAQRLKKNKDKKQELLFPELIERKQMTLYKRRLKSFQNDLDKQTKRGIDYYTKQYHLQHYKTDMLYIENDFSKEDNFDELQYFLDIKYILEKLNYHLAQRTLLNSYAHKKFELSTFIAMKNLLNLPQYSSIPLIRLSLLNIDLVEKEDENTFIALSKAIAAQTDIVPASFLKPFYTNLTNYCVKQLPKGKLSYYTDLFNIYKNMDDGNLLIMGDAIDVRLLKNIITIACRVKEYVWAKNMLEKYKNYINKNIKISVLCYNYGIIYFNQQKYKEALSHFNHVKKIDDIHEIGIKVTTLKCFYETDLYYETSTQQAIDSRMTFFKKNQKLPTTMKSAYKNFISIFNRLYKLKDVANKREKCIKIIKNLPKIKTELESKTVIQEKQWLLAKITALGNECK